LPIQVTGIETANHNQTEAGIVMMQNRKCQRKKKQVRGSEYKSDTVMPTDAPLKIWDTIKYFHPYKKEILIVVRTLNSIGANRNIIAAARGLQGCKTFYRGGEWTEEDVNGLLEEFRA
jgi:hypothetical protein